MLNKIKNLWAEFRTAIIIAVLFAVYFIGTKKGKDNEKASQNETVLQNISRANMARRRLVDNDYVQRLRKKYTRK